MLKINQSLVRKFHKPENYLEKMDRSDCQSPRAKNDNSRTISIRESIEETQPLVQLGNLKLKSSSDSKDSSESEEKNTRATCFSGLRAKMFSCFRREEVEEEIQKEHPKLTGSV